MLIRGAFLALAEIGGEASLALAAEFLAGPFSGYLKTELLAHSLAVVLSRTENAPLCFYTDRETAAETAVRLPTSRWMRCIAATEAAVSALAANANTRLTLTGLFDRLGSAG